MAKGASGAEHFEGFNVRDKDRGHKMASMFEKLKHSNPECEVSHEDVEDWIHADKGIVVTRTIAGRALIDADMNQTLKVKLLRTNRSDEETATEMIHRGPKLPTRTLHLRSSPKAVHVTRTQLRIIFIYKSSTDRITISSKRFPHKIILHFYSIHRKCFAHITKGAPRQKLPTIRVRWILNNIATFTTSTSLPNI